MEAFIGQIIMFAGKYAPRGWSFCEGQILPIAGNSSLYSILGTTYGGNGTTTFALPDLRGRTPIQAGAGPGLSNIELGRKGGAETVALTEAEMPSHSHTTVMQANTPVGRGKGTTTPTGAYIAEGGNYSTEKNVEMAADGISVGNSGGSLPHENRSPYLAVNYIIALEGIFPSRN